MTLEEKRLRLETLKTEFDNASKELIAFRRMNGYSIPIPTEIRTAYDTTSGEYYRLSAEVSAEDERIRRAAKDAELLAQGKTREIANARLAEITAQVRELLEEAEEHAKDFDLSFSISTKSMYSDLDFSYGEYSGWDSSNC